MARISSGDQFGALHATFTHAVQRQRVEQCANVPVLEGRVDGQQLNDARFFVSTQHVGDEARKGAIHFRHPDGGRDLQTDPPDRLGLGLLPVGIDEAVSGQPTVSTSNPNDTLVAQLKSLTDNAAHALVATCTDASGRVARVVLPIAHAPTATPAWIIDRTQRILYFDAASSTWTAVDGAGTRIAVARDGQPWVVNELGQVWRRNAGSAGYRDGAWVRVAEAGTASDIAIGWDGSVWALAQPEFDNGTHTILYFDAASQTFTRRDASGARLAVAPDGQPWAISAEGKVVRAARSGIDWSIPTPPSGFLRNYLTTTWENVPSPNGRLGSLTVGPLGTAWSIASDHSGPIFQYDGVARSWKQLGDAAGTDLAADADGVWATNQDGQVWRYALATGAWALVTNDIGATDIAVSAARLGQ